MLDVMAWFSWTIVAALESTSKGDSPPSITLEKVKGTDKDAGILSALLIIFDKHHFFDPTKNYWENIYRSDIRTGFELNEILGQL